MYTCKQAANMLQTGAGVEPHLVKVALVFFLSSLLAKKSRPNILADKFQLQT